MRTHASQVINDINSHQNQVGLPLLPNGGFVAKPLEMFARALPAQSLYNTCVSWISFILLGTSLASSIAHAGHQRHSAGVRA